MTIAILIVCSLVLVLAILIWLRDPVIVHPNTEWSVISEENSRALWNELMDLEGAYLGFRIHAMLGEDSEDVPAHDLTDAFAEAHDACLQISDNLGSANPYGVDPILTNYVALVWTWFARKARNYRAWEEIANEDAEKAKGVWFEVAKEAVKGGVAGFLGGLLAIPGILSSRQGRYAEEEAVFESRVAPIRSEMEALEYEKAALKARARGLQKHFASQFAWKFEA